MVTFCAICTKSNNHTPKWLDLKTYALIQAITWSHFTFFKCIRSNLGGLVDNFCLEVR